MMRRFFQWFGASGRYLPALAVVAILLGCHIARKDPWRLEVGVVLGMFAESALLGFPLLLAGQLLRHALPLAGGSPWQGDFVDYIGAGIYEELVFRLIMFTALSIVLVDLLRIERFWAGLLIVVSSAVLFSAYHYLGSERFAWGPFVFRTVAGLYFAAVFLVRGFGLTVGGHAAYDITLGIMLRAV
jgi:membrane protease YdiL (CAAX protease family)